MKKELLALQKKSTSKTEKSNLQAKIVAAEEAHPRQPRCQFFGEEIQMDASKHIWFGNSYVHLHAAIDDATGTLVGAYFDKEETLKGYYNIAKQILSKHGIPYKFKTDKRTVFEYKKKGSSNIEEDTFTQFSYASSQLGIKLETSSVPEFKARVERVFQTLQLRLIPLLRLENISTIEEANLFLVKYIKQFNKQFALDINHNKSVFEKQPDEQNINLTLAVLSERIIDSGHSIRYNKKYYRLVNRVNSPIYFNKGTKCMVIKSFDEKLFASVDNSTFALEEIPVTQAFSMDFEEVLEVKPKNIYIPNMKHPWKREAFEKFMDKQSVQENVA